MNELLFLGIIAYAGLACGTAVKFYAVYHIKGVDLAFALIAPLIVLILFPVLFAVTKAGGSAITKFSRGIKALFRCIAEYPDFVGTTAMAVCKITAKTAQPANAEAVDTGCHPGRRISNPHMWAIWREIEGRLAAQY